MKIAIIPRVRVFRKKQIEYCVERKLIIFLNKIYKNSSIVFLNEIKKIIILIYLLFQVEMTYLNSQI